jgi:hypothetical protein
MLTAALRFENATHRCSDWPVAYPADEQTDVPLDYGAEFPNPIPNHGSGSYVITLQFPPFDKVTGVTAKLTDAKGNPVEFFLSDPEHPATSFGQFGVICVIPKQPLQPQHAYSMRIDATWKGKSGSWTWSFSTVSLRGIEASDDRRHRRDKRLEPGPRHSRLRRDEEQRGGCPSTRGRRRQPVKVLSVIIPIAVWRQIAGTAEPGSFRSKVIEVQNTPQIAGVSTSTCGFRPLRSCCVS